MNNAFIGWFRLPGQLWQPAVTAGDEDAAWRLLHQHADKLGAKLIDLYVCPSDVDPRGRRRSRIKRARSA